MKYRVISRFKVISFANYSEALLFKNANGGTIYERIYSQER